MVMEDLELDAYFDTSGPACDLCGQPAGHPPRCARCRRWVSHDPEQDSYDADEEDDRGDDSP